VGGYHGWSDQQLLDIPYARFLQEKRVIEEAKHAQERSAWKREAFVGWQVSSAMGSKIGPFNKYLKKLGLQDKPVLTRDQVQREKEAAFAAAALVEARFDKGRPE
jgi:hypothetical protein